MLTQERLKELLSYDPSTGAFTWVAPLSTRMKAGDLAGYLRKDGYIQIYLEGVRYMAHRLAVLWVKGQFPTDKVDHKNNVRSDNRWDNLREGTQSFNMQNLKKAHKDSVTGLLGAYPYGDKFRAQIMVSGKLKNLGLFDTAEKAHSEYMAAKAVYHEGMVK